MNKAYQLIALVLLAACSNSHPQPSPAATGRKYERVKDWPRLPPGFHLGNPSGIGIDSQQNIVVFCRAKRVWPLILPMPQSLITANTILILDPHSGKIIDSWGAGLFIMPH